MTNAIPHLQPHVPGSPRTETSAYRFPPARPCAPSAADCTDEDLYAIVGDALRNGHDLYALLGSSEHVRAILELVQRLDLAHRDAVERAESAERALAVAGYQFAAYRGIAEAQLAAARERIRWLVAEHAKVSGENVGLRHKIAGTTPAAELDAAETLRFTAAEDEDTVVVDVDGGGR